ncbi:Uncharacterised protein [Pseudomonas aeruginosa]|nr:Uncharacterised protein [Pseudomonas aeruginosa]
MDVPPTVQDEQAVSRQLHSLSVRNLAHLAAALTQLGFELSRSSDPGTRQAANAFIGQLANINQDIDRQIELLSALDADNVGFACWTRCNTRMRPNEPTPGARKEWRGCAGRERQSPGVALISLPGAGR